MSARIPSRSKAVASGDPCPCGLPADYALCCGRYHDGPLHLLAPDPQALMRSRYSAFVKDLRAYLLATWHASERPPHIEAPEPGLTWLGLSIKHSALTGTHTGVVSFVARFKVGGRAHRMEETSRFVLEHGHWFYVDAQPVGADPHAVAP
jgi:SEC-C motif-containing protein